MEETVKEILSVKFKNSKYIIEGLMVVCGGRAKNDGRLNVAMAATTELFFSQCFLLFVVVW